VRLWSLHPRYLDSLGLVAVWREGLLALEVLKGNTTGYTHHPQLARFRDAKEPVESMKCYLSHIYQESVARGYNFNSTKIAGAKKMKKLKVTTGQLSYELKHLKRKLKNRHQSKYRELEGLQLPEPHPLFRTVAGDIEEWEKVW